MLNNSRVFTFTINNTIFTSKSVLLFLKLLSSLTNTVCYVSKKNFIFSLNNCFYLRINFRMRFDNISYPSINSGYLPMNAFTFCNVILKSPQGFLSLFLLTIRTSGATLSLIQKCNFSGEAFKTLTSS